MFENSEIVNYNPGFKSVYYNLNLYGNDRDRFFVSYDGTKTQKFSGINFAEDCYKHFDLILLEYEKRPFFIVNGPTNLISRLEFSKAELEHLKNNPIAFYMYEPLNLMMGPDAVWFHDGHGKFESVYELDQIEMFNKKFGGKLDIHVYTCDYKIGEAIKEMGLYPNIKIETCDIFIGGLACDRIIKGRTKQINYDFHKKSTCPNFRWTPYREMTVAYMRGQEYQNDSYITYYHTHDAVEFRFQLPFDHRKLKQWNTISNGMCLMQNELPYFLEAKNPQAINSGNDHLPDFLNNKNIKSDFDIEPYYVDSFAFIVNETKAYQSWGEISEKIFNPILYRKPFIVYGSPHLLKYLRELGFKTYGDIFDESYDDIEDHKERFEVFLEQIDFIHQKSLDELKKMMEKVAPIIEYNEFYLRTTYIQKFKNDVKRFSKESYRKYEN